MELLNYQPSSLPSQAPKELGFSPYEFNYGTIVAVAGPDFAVIASDKRLSSGFSIYTRNQTKLFKLSKQTVLGSAGCWCDVLTFTRILETKMKMYEHQHHKLMKTSAVAQLVTQLLYYKRFFPYYIHNVVAGLDEDGKGRVYSYDSVGHRGESSSQAVGSSSALLQPLLDNHVAFKNMEDVKTPPPLTLEKAITVISDAFISAAERDIYTGDGVHMYIITKEGIAEKEFPLRKD